MSYLFNNTFVPKNTDAFGRSRVSEPLTLFDSSHRFRDNGQWNSNISNGGTFSFNSTQGLIDLTVTTSSGSEVVRETTKVFAYQPGKSLLVLNTFVFAATQSGLRQRCGYFDTQNGFYLEQVDNTINVVKRSLVSGVIVNTEIEKSNWNIDPMNGQGPSGLTLDLTMAQIFWMDFEWLGVGTVRCGFVINGEFYTCHKFHHANLINSTYTTTACLPLRCEITNTSITSTSSTFKQICSSILSEGGYEVRGDSQNISTPILSPQTLTVAGTFYPVISIRLKSDRLEGISIPTGITCLAQDTGNYVWKLVEGGTTTGGTWSSYTDSIVEYNITGTTFSGGTTVTSGFFSNTNQGSNTSSLDRDKIFSRQLKRNTFTNTSTEFTLCIAAEVVGGLGNQVWGSIDWEEITR
jgi:hypothetical protein